MTALAKSKADELTMDSNFLSSEVILPSFTTAERDAIASPATGRIIYNSTTNKINFYSGSSWEAVTSA